MLSGSIHIYILLSPQEYHKIVFLIPQDCANFPWIPSHDYFLFWAPLHPGHYGEGRQVNKWEQQKESMVSLYLQVFTDKHRKEQPILPGSCFLDQKKKKKISYDLPYYRKAAWKSPSHSDNHLRMSVFTFSHPGSRPQWLSLVGSVPPSSKGNSI